MNDAHKGKKGNGSKFECIMAHLLYDIQKMLLIQFGWLIYDHETECNKTSVHRALCTVYGDNFKEKKIFNLQVFFYKKRNVIGYSVKLLNWWY